MADAREPQPTPWFAHCRSGHADALEQVQPRGPDYWPQRKGSGTFAFVLPARSTLGGFHPVDADTGRSVCSVRSTGGCFSRSMAPKASQDDLGLAFQVAELSRLVP